MVNKGTFVGFSGGDRLNRTPWIVPALKCLPIFRSFVKAAKHIYHTELGTSMVCIMGVRRNFSRWAISKFCLPFTGCWRCNANGRSQNGLPLLPQ